MAIERLDEYNADRATDGFLLAVRLAELGIEPDRKGMTPGMIQLLDTGKALVARFRSNPTAWQPMKRSHNVIDARWRFTGASR